MQTPWASKNGPSLILNFNNAKVNLLLLLQTKNNAKYSRSKIGILKIGEELLDTRSRSNKFRFSNSRKFSQCTLKSVEQKTLRVLLAARCQEFILFKTSICVYLVFRVKIKAVKCKHFIFK